MKNVAVPTTARSGTLVKSSRATAVQSVYISSAMNGDHSLRTMSVSACDRWMKGLIGLAVGVPLPMTPVMASALDGIRPELIACFTTGGASRCARALDLTEQLQRRAASRERFPCQTHLLGLQADVVMAQLSEGRGQQALESLEASDRICQGL